MSVQAPTSTNSYPVAPQDRLNLWHLYSEMLRIRTIELRIAQRYDEKEMRCPVHLSIGQEAVAVGVCGHLSREDKVMSAHRSHGHYLAKGGNVRRMLAEIYGRRDGCCGGRGGSMHLMDRESGFYGAVPIVGSTLPIALGLALAEQRGSTGRITTAFFGEGASEEGVFTETLNLACVMRVPMLFVCENNSFSVYTPLRFRRAPEFNFADYVRSHGSLYFSGHGNDVEEVVRVTATAIQSMRDNPVKPCVVEFSTWRYYEHCGPGKDDHLGYRQEDHVREWLERCPLDVAARRLLEEDPAAKERMEGLREQFTREIDALIEEVRNSPRPDPATLQQGVFAP